MVNCDEDEITTFIDVCSGRVYETCHLDLQMNSEADSLTRKLVHIMKMKK